MAERGRDNNSKHNGIQYLGKTERQKLRWKVKIYLYISDRKNEFYLKRTWHLMD